MTSMKNTQASLGTSSLIYWPSMNKDIEDFVKQYPTCKKLNVTQLAEPLIGHDVPYSPWQRLGADFMD